MKESPVNHGSNTATMPGPMLIEWIKKQYGFDFKKAQIYNIIRSLGFIYQKGKGIYPKTNEQQLNKNVFTIFYKQFPYHNMLEHLDNIKTHISYI